ncbi:ketopantoate reductase family protein [Anaerotignum sp.]|uniref:ketopantoate reductase family protein n=1 Tax=Anaerotignum sp. TaxID=2039241 RepID=UPI0027152F83|nr:2-dehydropantoate 2-reductase [Anaerotignum sp.]
MKIAIIGAGAMGCLYGGKLSTVPDNQVFLLDVWKEHVNAINKEGLCMEENGELLHYHNLTATTEAATVGVVDLVIIFVKSILTRQAVEGNKAVFGDNTMALTLQNGMGNVESIGSQIGAKNVMAGTTAHGATMLGPGKIRHAGVGKTMIGELSGVRSKRINEIAEVFSAAGLEVEVSENVLGLVWDKLLVNVGINALTGITKLTNGELLAYPEIEGILEEAVREGVAVANAKGIVLGHADPVAHTKAVCKATAANKSSMLQDVLNHKPTEIDMINGAVVREGKNTGVATSVNQVLCGLIHYLERERQGIQFDGYQHERTLRHLEPD